MTSSKLLATQIHVGLPLPFDTFDAEGSLLLRRGIVIDNAGQLERLLERGMYREGGLAGVSAESAAQSVIPSDGPRPKARKVSVFELISDIQLQLESLLTEATPVDFSGRVSRLAQQLQHGFKLDSDAALASIQVFHSGRYAARRMMHGAILMELLLGQIGASEAQRRVVMCAALTMNIAMMDLQDVLYSQVSPPTPEQSAQVRQHPSQGVELLRSFGVVDETWLLIVAQHHETIDAKGYPAGLSGLQISRYAQLLSLADRYGAMATGRGYRAPALPNVVLKQIFMDKDKGVDAKMAGLLVKAVGVYPPGSLVALANGDIAVVVKRTQSASQPVVRCVKTQRNEILEQPRKRLTSEPAYAIVRLIPMADLGFSVNPALLWDEGFELDQM